MSDLGKEEIIEIVKKEITNTYAEGKAKALQGLLDLYNKEKEKNKELKKQLNDIHSNFCKFNWQESNGKQVYNQLAELYESIYRKENKNE